MWNQQGDYETGLGLWGVNTSLSSLLFLWGPDSGQRLPTMHHSLCYYIPSYSPKASAIVSIRDVLACRQFLPISFSQQARYSLVQI